MSKLTSKIEIRSKKDKKTGLMKVDIYSGKTKLIEWYITEGDMWSQTIECPILLENGLVIYSLPKLGNAK